MPRYLVLAKSFINNTIVEEGEVVEYDGKPGSNLELVKATKSKTEAKAESKSESKDSAANNVFKAGE